MDRVEPISPRQFSMYSNRVTIQGQAPDNTTPAVKVAPDGTVIVADATLNATLQALIKVQTAIQNLMVNQPATGWQASVQALLNAISTNITAIEALLNSDATRDTAYQTAVTNAITAIEALLNSNATRDTAYQTAVTNAITASANVAPVNVTIATSATLLIASRSARLDLLIINTDTVNPIYIGNAGVTTATGFLLGAGASISMKTKAAVYAIATGGSVVANVMETY